MQPCVHVLRHRYRNRLLLSSDRQQRPAIVTEGRHDNGRGEPELALLIACQRVVNHDPAGLVPALLERAARKSTAISGATILGTPVS